MRLIYCCGGSGLERLVKSMLYSRCFCHPSNFSLKPRQSLLISSPRSLTLGRMIIGLSDAFAQAFVASAKRGECRALGWLFILTITEKSSGLPLIGGLTILLNLRGAPEDSDSFPDRAGLLTGFLASLHVSTFLYPPSGLRTPTR
jgi:hypothetical protein